MKIHRTIKKVSSDIENLKFNTAIASLMTLINEITADGHIGKDDLGIFVKLLSPFAPHLCEEIWEFLGGEGTACCCSMAGIRWRQNGCQDR